MITLMAYWVDLRSASRTHLRVRLVALLGAVIFTLSFIAAGGGGWLSWTGIVVFGLLLMVNPTTLMPVTFVIFAIASWWASVDGPWHWALLPAALGLLLVHAACALAASVPPQAALPTSVLSLYAVRVALVAAGTAVVWALAALLAGLASGAGGPIPGIIGLTLLLLALILYARTRRDSTSTAR